jgi:hypothetical protein
MRTEVGKPRAWWAYALRSSPCGEWLGVRGGGEEDGKRRGDDDDDRR